MTWKHGQRVKCKIQGMQIDDARISVDESGKPFICQNRKEGTRTDDKLGYLYSWEFDCRVTDLVAIEGFYVNVGDVVGWECFRAKVLAVMGDAFWISLWDTFESYGYGLTFKQAAERGFKVLPAEPEKQIELSMDQIAEKFGMDVKQLKIKKD